MPDYTEKVWDLVDQTSFVTNNKERKFILAKNYKLVFSFIPLLLQLFIDEQDIICPSSYYQVYSLSILFIPTFCVLLVYVVGINQSWIKKHSKHYYAKHV